MNFWNVLDIETTDNISVVKKAYAKKLKICHPEDDPEGYQELREAYDSALKYIKNNKKKTSIKHIDIDIGKKEKSEKPEIILEEDNLENTKQFLPHINILKEFTEKAPSFEESVEEFIKKAQFLYNSFFSRINIENWRALLNSEVMWYMGNKELLSNKMIEFLMINHYLPQNIWKLLEHNFNWNDKKGYLYKRYPEKFMNYLFTQINDNNGLRYCYFKEYLGIDYENFLKYREEAYEALSNNDFNYAEECIVNAQIIYADDPDLLIIKGRFYIHIGEIDKALHIFGDLIQRDSEDIYARFYRAKVLYDKGEIHNALNDCKCIEPHNFHNCDFMILFAKCYVRLDEFDKAKELLLLLLNINSLHTEAKSLLEQVNLQLIYKLRKELKRNKKYIEIKFKLNDLYKELGMLENRQIISKLWRIMTKRFFVCLLILLVQVAVIHLSVKRLGIKNTISINNMRQFMAINSEAHLINNSEDINKLPAELSIVKGNIANAGFLDLYRIPTKDKNKKLTMLYLSLKEAKAKEIFKDMNGYICMGTLGDKKVIMVVNYDEANQIYKNKTFDFKGTLRYMPTDNLVDEVKKRYMTNKFEDEFVTDKFIDTTRKISSRRKVTVGIVNMLLFIQVSLIIQGMLAGYRIVKANRRL